MPRREVTQVHKVFQLLEDRRALLRRSVRQDDPLPKARATEDRQILDAIGRTRTSKGVENLTFEAAPRRPTAGIVSIMTLDSIDAVLDR